MGGMGHTKPQDLKDIRDALEKVRKLEHLKEKSPNVFYFKSKPFLHIHDKNGERWADVMQGGRWVRLEMPFAAKAPIKKAFLAQVVTAHRSALTTM